MRPQYTRKSRHNTSFWEYQKEGSSHRRAIAGGYFYSDNVFIFTAINTAESNVDTVQVPPPSGPAKLVNFVGDFAEGWRECDGAGYWLVTK